MRAPVTNITTAKGAGSPQQLLEERIAHSAVRVDRSDPLTHLPPPLTIRRHDMLFREERALVQQRTAASLVRPVIERVKEGCPRGLVAVAGRVDRVERN